MFCSPSLCLCLSKTRGRGGRVEGPHSVTPETMYSTCFLGPLSSSLTASIQFRCPALPHCSLHCPHAGLPPLWGSLTGRCTACICLRGGHVFTDLLTSRTEKAVNLENSGSSSLRINIERKANCSHILSPHVITCGAAADTLTWPTHPRPPSRYLLRHVATLPLQSVAGAT